MALDIAPLSGSRIALSNPVRLFDEDRYLGSPAWSPDGEYVYYLSERDGRCSIWAQKLDFKTKKPVGESKEVYRSPQNRWNLNFPRGDGTISVARDKIAFWVGEAKGNLYLAAPGKK